MKAIQLTEFSGADGMNYVDVPDPEPGDGQVVVDVARCGVNFADTHATRDDYLAKQELPLIPGGEISGRTPDGRRVAAMLATGGYAQKVAVHEAMLVPVPDAVSDDQAAALLLQGLTAHALIHRSARLEPGETVVVEAAAGGTGSLAVQLAKRHGARVIGLASSPEKRELVERLGADATVDSRSEDLQAAILEANGGDQVDAVLEMAGGTMFEASLRTLAPLGHLRNRIGRAESGCDRRADEKEPGRHRLLAGASAGGHAGGRPGHRGALWRGRDGRPGDRDRRRAPALGGSPGARGPRGTPHPREDTPGSLLVAAPGSHR
jgi:NADPH2:quinone reductase